MKSVLWIAYCLCSLAVADSAMCTDLCTQICNSALESCINNVPLSLGKMLCPRPSAQCNVTCPKVLCTCLGGILHKCQAVRDQCQVAAPTSKSPCQDSYHQCFMNEFYACTFDFTLAGLQDILDSFNYFMPSIPFFSYFAGSKSPDNPGSAKPMFVY